MSLPHKTRSITVKRYDFDIRHDELRAVHEALPVELGR